MNLLKQIFLLFGVCYIVKGQRICPIVNGRQIECKSIEHCPTIKAAIQNPNNTPTQNAYLRSLLCGWIYKTPKVCCTEEATTTTTTTTTRAPPINAECFTPDNNPGKCIDLYSCTSLINILHSGRQDGMDYLGRSHCSGKADNIVCCASGTSIVDASISGSSNSGASNSGLGKSGTSNSVSSNSGSSTSGAENSACTSQMAALLPDPSTRCCGKHPLSVDKIMGGTSTGVDQYPWLVLIEYTTTRFLTKTLCGGSLISGRYVMTAGHCVVGRVLDIGTPTSVRLGEYDKSHEGQDCIPAAGRGIDCTQGITRIPIERITVHPQYNSDDTTLGYDIALIRMKRTASYTYFIRPVCLPTQDITLRSNFKVTAAGWGAVNSTQGSSPVKQHVELPFISREECQLAYNSHSQRANLWSGQICAGGEKGKDSCRGDSGGPLMYKNNDIIEAIGVVSFGPNPCGIKDIPGVYTNVYEFSSWIRDTIVA